MEWWLGAMCFPFQDHLLPISPHIQPEALQDQLVDMRVWGHPRLGCSVLWHVVNKAPCSIMGHKRPCRLQSLICGINGLLPPTPRAAAKRTPCAVSYNHADHTQLTPITTLDCPLT